jgi:hypothetical protein
LRLRKQEKQILRCAKDDKRTELADGTFFFVGQTSERSPPSFVILREAADLLLEPR